MRSSLYISLFFVVSSAQALSGKLESLTEYFPKDLGPPTYTVAPRLGIELDQDQKVTKKFSYSFKGTFQSNPASTSQPENYFGDLKEAYVEYKPNRSTKVLLGWNTVNWGVLDLYSPMDVINQHTYFNPLNTDKRGAGMVNLQWNPRGWSFSGIYIPAQAKPILPSSDSRWLPRDSIKSFSANNEIADLPPFVRYDIQDPVTLNQALNNNYGFKIERHWDAFDLHAMYFNGASSMPSIVPDVANAPLINLNPQTVQLTNPVILHPLFYRTQTTGLGFSGTIGDVIVRGESTYQSAVGDNDVGYFYSQWSWQHGLGLEKNWEVGRYTVTTLVHYYYGVYPHDDSTFDSNIPTSGFRLFDNAPMFGFRWAISDEKFFYGSVLYNIAQQGFFWTVGYQQKLTDAIRWDISWRDISASKDGLLHAYDKNDYAVMDLSYFF
jgi:hypothetical protein